MADLRVGFLGAGRMASALVRGWLDAKLVQAENVWASDPIETAREKFAEGIAVHTTSNNHEVVANSDLLVLAVKPQYMDGLLHEIHSDITETHLVVSIAAGVPLARLARGIGSQRRLVRVMPNTPCLIGASASAYSPGENATDEDIALVGNLLDAVGKAFRLPEPLLDAVTGLSGSGPAFVYVMIEALSDGGVRMGLPRDVATALAAQTLLGSAKMILETGEHPGSLKDAVTSPGGTTIAGLHALERAGLRGALMNAVEAATQRSIELSSS